jgi:hypothetical protein
LAEHYYVIVLQLKDLPVIAVGYYRLNLVVKTNSSSRQLDTSNSGRAHEKINITVAHNIGEELL